MTVEEIYKELAEHMIKGLMIHDQLADYYDFLGLKGYRKCHEYHYLDEACNYRKLCKYFVNHHNKLIHIDEIDNPEVIPESWYKYTRQDVDSNTKKNAVKTGLRIWVEWERDTKELYEQMYKELIDINEVASACIIKCFVEDVDHELEKAEKYQLYKEAVDYSLSHIIGEQEDKCKKYERKLEELGMDKYGKHR